MCRLHRATLVIARLDRLARNAAFLLALRDDGVDFVAADQPGANRMTVGILAMVAEYEAEAISSRTKAALAAAKRRGVILGKPGNLTNEDRHRGTAASALVRQRRSRQQATDLAPILADITASGSTSLRQIARALNEAGWRAARGGDWSPGQVRRVLTRLKS
jgi:DNA invertase Pin-like site-specific DNA recombinase